MNVTSFVLVHGGLMAYNVGHKPSTHEPTAGPRTGKGLSRACPPASPVESRPKEFR